MEKNKFIRLYQNKRGNAKHEYTRIAYQDIITIASNSTLEGLRKSLEELVALQEEYKGTAFYAPGKRLWKQALKDLNS